MSKVDLSVFEEIKQVTESDECLETIVYNLCQGDMDFISYEVWKENETLLNSTFDYEHLDQDGGGEGGSEYCYGVFKIRDKIYKAEYSYYSHHGHDYDGILNTLREVTPKEKTIVVYE